MMIGVQSTSRTRPDGQAVAARVVHERDAQCPLGAGGDVAGIRLRQRVAPDPPDQVQRPADVPLARERQQHDVLAALEIGRVRPRARVDDRMVVDGLETRVVPAAAQVVALLVVGCRAEPGRLHRAVLELLEHDEALLEVGFVIVGAVECRAPVVHRVEEHVVEDHPATLADDPAVVDDPRVTLADRS